MGRDPFDDYLTRNHAAAARRRAWRLADRVKAKGVQQVNDSMQPDEVEAIGARQTVDKVLGQLVAARRARTDDATLRQLARVRLELLDDLDLVELLLLAAALVDERIRANLTG